MITPILLAVLAWSGPAVDYAREIKPVLAARCASCHGAIRQKAGLRLDTSALIRRGGDSGPAIEPGNGGESLLIERVTATHVSERMPPESEGTPLSPAEVAALRAWIDQGAHAPSEPTPPDPRRHWAFQAPVRRAIPRVMNSLSSNPIDAFLHAAHQARGLKSAPPVGKDLWLRRVTLDLIGLPPTRQQLHAFREDSAPDAAEKVVDRLLGSPQYGERWARHWMDIWRYSDWYGLGQEVRYSHPHLWHWRDWIIESLNADKGYDRMVTEMLAGDELAPDDPDTVRATGFLARNWDIFNRNVWLASTVEHTSRAFLGLTLQCARCHDHKFDPISQADYYRLRAFFEPYHIRVDRVPGEPDRAKAGLPRAFDDFLDRPTFLFVRGEESRPDTTRPLRPAPPAVLGDAVRIVPVPLPLTASCPDKRPFVIDEAIAEADRAIVRARADVDKARLHFGQADAALNAARDVDAKAALRFATATGKPDQMTAAVGAVESLARAQQTADLVREDRDVADAALTLAEAKRSALNAVLTAERLEDDGAKATGSASWAEAARTASANQRALGLAEANHNLVQARRDSARAQRTLDGLLIAASVRDDAIFKEARAKAATSLVKARARLSESEKQLDKARSLVQGPPTTDYTPRTLAFPRAKTTYRDTPSNAPYSKVSTGRRLALASWIVDRRNPLAARVAVNHIWARHFGEPLVGSMSDFGLRAARPELVDLLDWLAVEFMESGWSLKHLHRLIVTSQAYQMRSSDSGPDDPNLRIDPDNHYAWRMNAGRMEGEVIRDSLLFLADRLDTTMGGPDLPIDFAESGGRRTLYYRVARDERISLLTSFDAPNVEDCYRRHETIVPQQALAMINSGMVLTRAGQIATAIDREVGADASPSTRDAFVDSVFERILGRAPVGAELLECRAGLARLAEAFAAEKGGADPGRTPESRARSALVHVLLNHNDFITIR
ncbi:MAG: DUF1549 domain-containing protein [Isosphaeraceae bacterium]